MATTINSVSKALLDKMNPNASSTKSATPGVETAEGMQNRFMTLLTTQMQNQDPLNPMDNSQVTSQMAQLSTVSGISQLNSTMKTLLSSLQSSQSMQAANLIGKSVVVPGNAITLNAGLGEFGVQLETPVTNAQATISDAHGTVIDVMDLGSLPIGISAIPWDGTNSAGAKAPDGNYTFSISAKSGMTAVPATALSVGLVTSVSTGAAGAGAQLNIPTIGATNFSNVLQIL